MGLFDAFKKKSVNFEEIDSIEKAREEHRKGNLDRMYIMPLMFGGSEGEDNVLYVPVGTNKLKNAYDNALADLVAQGKASSFKGFPEYKGNSVIPCRITMISGKNGEEVLKKVIELW